MRLQYNCARHHSEQSRWIVLQEPVRGVERSHSVASALLIYTAAVGEGLRSSTSTVQWNGVWEYGSMGVCRIHCSLYGVNSMEYGVSLIQQS